MRSIGSGQTTLVSFDYKNPVAQRASAESLNNQGDVFPYEVYENTGSDGFRTYREGEKLAQQRMGERDANTQTFEARGNDRTAQPGRFFKLGDHFSAEPQAGKNGEAPHANIADRHYLILSVDHEASNNYQAGPSAPSHYENTFRCVRKNIQWRPGRHYNSQPCTYPGIQTAIVVGPAGSEIHTDGYGRVKVQFHWDRLGKYDENSSPWLRVMSPGAGSEFGNIRLPRVGEEVAVLYLDANIDHPVILGALYNAVHMPPWRLPDQQALSGLRSRELQAGDGSGRGNHLVLDDTPGKIQAQLKSDHQCSQLSLGHITRIEDTSGRRDERGDGWEIATNAWGVARAGKGMLITTEARPNATSQVKDMGETIQRLASAQQKQKDHAEVAEKNRAQESGQQSRVAASVKAQNDAVRGAGASSARRSFPELSEPHLILASAAGIATTTAQSTHIASEGDTAITTGKSVAIAAGDGFFASVVTTLRLFVQRAGMKLIAVAGDIDVQTLSDSINLLAKLNITQMGNRIVINAKEDIVINGGGSYVKFSKAGIEHGTTGTFVAHAASHSLIGPKSLALASNEMEKGHFDQTPILHDLEGPLANRKFELMREDGTIIRGVTDSEGRIPIQKGIDMATAKLRILGG
jgi:type VI secretion system secreted protein VgrG